MGKTIPVTLLTCAAVMRKQSQIPRNKWAWLCSNKTLFTRAGNGTDLAHGLRLPALRELF